MPHPFVLLRPHERQHFTHDDQVEWRAALLQVEQAMYPMNTLVRMHGHTVIALERSLAYWRDRALAAERDLVASTTAAVGTDIAA